jgi:succinate-semialdehyde dehydrogenase/glutarate-semialdehyde dehydrogenase
MSVPEKHPSFINFCLKVERIVKESVEQGAKVIVGGGRLSELGQRFYKPTVVVNVKRTMPLFEEEIFGPVTAIMSFESEEDAINLANDTDKGLCGKLQSFISMIRQVAFIKLSPPLAYVYTNNLRQAWKLVENLDFGMVGINEPMLSTCEAPFGNLQTKFYCD